MDLSDYVRQDATALEALLDRGEVTADELRTTALEAIEQVEPQINAIVHGPYERPGEHSPDGPLAGVPFAVKDLICSAAGEPLEQGSRLLAGHVAEADTTLMERFRRAGLVTLARTATPELGFNANTAPVAHGPTRNPWDTGHIPGGSSGGSAALVAARAVPLAHANDGGGSIRIPAACCGLVGLKPTRGRVPVGPDVGEPLSGLAAELAVTRSVRDCAAVLDAVSGPAPGDKYYVAAPSRPFAEAVGADPGRLRVALYTATFGAGICDPEVVAAVEAVGRELEGLGHAVEPAAPTVDAEALAEANLAIWSSFLALIVEGIEGMPGRKAGPDSLETATWSCVQHGRQISAVELEVARMTQNAVGRAWGHFLDQYDVFLCPTLPMAPPEVGSLNQNDPRHTTARSWTEEVFSFIPFTPIFNVTGQPSVSLPLGMSSAGLPLGVMLSAQSLREDTLLAVAAQLEQAMPWEQRRPPVCAG